MRIWKYPIKIDERVSLLMPTGAKLLTFQRQRGFFALWALVDESATETEHTFRIYGTGHPIEQVPGEYVGTVQEGSLVWHLFDETEILIQN